MLLYIYPVIKFHANLNLTPIFFCSPYVNGLERYEDAIQRGSNGDDCALYYEECPYSLVKLPKFF